MSETREFPHLRAGLAIVAAAIIPYLINLDSFLPVADQNQIFRGLTKGILSVMSDPANLNYHWFRPLPVLLCRFDGLLWGTKVWGYRLTNILFFSSCGLLVWAVARKFFKPWAAWLAGLIFVTHPIHVGTVIWLSGREDLVPGFFLFGSAALLINRRDWLRMLAGHFFYLLALFSKETAALFPAALFIGELAGGASRNRAMLKALPSGIMAFAYVAIRMAVGYIPGRHGFSHQSVMQSPVMMIRDAASFVLNTLYIFIPLWHPLDVLGRKYPDAATLSGRLFNFQTLWPALYIIFGAIFLLLWIFREFRASADLKPAYFAAGWFMVFLLPTMHVLALMAGFRYFFIPMLGAAVFLVWVSKEALSRHSARARTIVITVFIIICLIMNVREQLRWKESSDIASRITWAAIRYARKLPQGTVLNLYNLPVETTHGRMVFPVFDNISLPMAARLLGKVEIKVIGQPGPDCGASEVRCISAEELMAESSSR